MEEVWYLTFWTWVSPRLDLNGPAYPYIRARVLYFSYSSFKDATTPLSHANYPKKEHICLLSPWPLAIHIWEEQHFWQLSSTRLGSPPCHPWNWLLIDDTILSIKTTFFKSLPQLASVSWDLYPSCSTWCLFYHNQYNIKPGPLALLFDYAHSSRILGVCW